MAAYRDELQATLHKIEALDASRRELASQLAREQDARRAAERERDLLAQQLSGATARLRSLGYEPAGKSSGLAGLLVFGAFGLVLLLALLAARSSAAQRQAAQDQAAAAAAATALQSPSF